MGNVNDFSLLVEKNIGLQLEFEYLNMMHSSTFDSNVQNKISGKFKKFKSKNVFKKHTLEIVGISRKLQSVAELDFTKIACF